METGVVGNGQVYKFGTWNVRGLTEKKREVFAEIEVEDVDLAVLTETKLRGSGREVTGSYVHLFSGIRGGTPRAGVSIYLKRELENRAVWVAVSERLVLIKLPICGRKFVIVGVYGTLETAENRIKDAFQEGLKGIVGGVPKDCELFLLGDFNARVGCSKESRVVGEFGEKEDANKNGVRLLQFCEEFDLKIQNTFFNQQDDHKYTWYHPRSSAKTLIDYVITRQSSSVVVDDVFTSRWLECNTDHLFLQATIFLPCINKEVSGCIGTNLTELREYNDFALYSKTLRLSYKKSLDTLIDLSIGTSTEAMYQHLKECIHSASINVFGLKGNTTLWNHEIKNSRVNVRQAVFEELENRKQDEDKLLDTTKNEIWKGICSRIDIVPTSEKNNLIWDTLNKMQNKTHRNNFLNKKLNCKFYQILLNKSKVNNMKISSEIIERESFSFFVTIEEVSKALDDLEDCKRSPPSGLTIKLLRYSSCKAKQLLRNLIQAIFDGEAIPKEVSEVYIFESLNAFEENSSKSIPTMENVQSHSIMRVINWIISSRLKSSLTQEMLNVIPDEPHMSVAFTLRMLFQKNSAKQNQPFYCAFVDLADCYADVSPSQLYNELECCWQCKYLVRLMKRICSESIIRVVQHLTVSEPLCIKESFVNGNSLSSVLFKIFVVKVLSAWSDQNRKDSIVIHNRKLNYLFSDNTLVLISKDRLNLEIMIKSLKTCLKKMFQVQLRDVQCLGGEALNLIDIHETKKDQIDFYGMALDVEGRCSEEVYGRILAAKKAIGMLHFVASDSAVTRRNKKRIFNSIISNILTFGCETWTLTEELKHSLDFIQRYWRWCCAAYPDPYSEHKFRERIGKGSSIFPRIMMKKVSWYAEVKAMHPDRWPRLILEWTPEGKKRPGRPRKEWESEVMEFIEENPDFGYLHRTFDRTLIHRTLTVSWRG